jgi:predicted nucleotidyltransferase
MHLRATYPTPEHQAAAEVITTFFSTSFEVEAVLLVNSCARGKATRDSCLDIVVLAKPEILHTQLTAIGSAWDRFEQTDAAITAMKQVGKYSVVHPDFIDGVFTPQERNEGGGPDGFELEIGNFLAYSVPLWQGSEYYAHLKKWLPSYDEELRQQRLHMVRQYCLNNLDHIPLFIERGLYFQSFDRLYNAYREFLQALFIARRTYPIAYDKWIEEQLVDILGLPALYDRVCGLFEISEFASTEIADKAEELEEMLAEFAPQNT